MPALHALALAPTQPRHHADVPEDQRALLNTLRLHAVTCRAEAHLDFFAACALIDPETVMPLKDRASMLLRVLGQALPRQPIFHRPGERQLSFDERWLLSLISAHGDGNLDGVEFLLRSRVEPSKRRLLSLLVRGLADGPAA